MNTKTTVMVKLAVEGIHNFPAAAELFPPVSFLAHPHRHMFHITASKLVRHDDRDIEFIMFKRDVKVFMQTHFNSEEMGCLNFGSWSCEKIADSICGHFDCEWVEVWEDNENGAKVERIR